MSTATISEPRTSLPASATLSFGGVLRAERIKFFSLRSTWWSFGVYVAISIGLAALMGSTFWEDGANIPAEQQTALVLQVATFGVFFGQLILATLGVLVIGGEFSTGMIRSSLTAVPKRIPVLVAKAIVLGVSAFVLGIVAALASYAVGGAFLASFGVTASLADPDLWVPLLGSGLYLAVVSVFALGVGTIVRSSAGGITAAIGAIILLPIVLMMLPVEWLQDLQPYLLMNAGLASFGMNGFVASDLSTAANLIVIGIWAAVPLIVGGVLLKRRDA